MEGTITITKNLYLQMQVNSEKLNRDEPDMDKFEENEKIRIAIL